MQPIYNTPVFGRKTKKIVILYLKNEENKTYFICKNGINFENK